MTFPWHTSSSPLRGPTLVSQLQGAKNEAVRLPSSMDGGLQTMARLSLKGQDRFIQDALFPERRYSLLRHSTYAAVERLHCTSRPTTAQSRKIRPSDMLLPARTFHSTATDMLQAPFRELHRATARAGAPLSAAVHQHVRIAGDHAVLRGRHSFLGSGC
jgi:hypothetical protein